MLSHAHIWAAIDALALRNDLSPSGLARKAGLDPTSFNKSKRQSADGRLRWPSTESLAKIMDATNTKLSAFIELVDNPYAHGSTTIEMTDDILYTGLPSGEFPKPSGPNIPLLGFAQAGTGGFFDDAGFPAGQGWEQIDFPAGQKLSSNVFALEVQGDSMMPLYRDGDVLIVEPNAQLRKGDRVVAKNKDGEVMAKILTKETSEFVQLTSINPAHPDLEFSKQDMEWIARIVWASQ